MKTEKRILGLLTAVVMLFGSMTIVGSATQSKTQNFIFLFFLNHTLYQTTYM